MKYKSALSKRKAYFVNKDKDGVGKLTLTGTDSELHRMREWAAKND
jgi:hypothetical protein